MSDFKDSLNDELDKRRETTASLPPAKLKKKSSFSFKSFIAGIVIFSILLGGLVLWAWSKTNTTQTALLEKLPSKTAIVETSDGNIMLSENKTTLTMPEIEVEPTKAIPPQENIEVANTNDIGDMPQTNIETGDKPYKLFQAKFNRKTSKPLLSFIITDLGLSETKTKNISQNFPKEISFNFSPYSKNIQALVDEARNNGHEVWLTLPLETKEYPLNDPGPSTLLVNASTEKNKSRLYDILGSAQNYVGFISEPNHVFKTEDADVNPVFNEIFERGLAIIDSNMSLHSFVGDLAKKNEYPYAQNNLWLDDNLSPTALNQNMRKIAEYGDMGKDIIVMLRPYPASLKTVQKFLNSKAAESFELAPVSTQLKTK